MARDILEFLRLRRMDAGNPLTEREFCEAFQVSRTPVRGALSYLAEQGIVEQKRNRGYFLKVGSHELRLDSVELPASDEEELLISVVDDWFAGRTRRSLSQAEFCRHYGLGRSTATRILQRLADDGVVSRKRGHGWRFELTPDARTVREESFRFRLALEPDAIRSPDFVLDRNLASLSRDNHKLALDAKPNDASSQTLADLDAGFHRLIGVSSRNRYFLSAIERQNALRRTLNRKRNSSLAPDTWAEHMGILDALEQEDRTRAADLMAEHIVNAHVRASRPL